MNSRFGKEAAITPKAVRAQVQRILASEGFARCGRMQRFLQFIVEEYLGGHAHQLGEYAIGVSVYDRGPDFEPALDPIVRNDARRLRTKLLEYYRGSEAAGELVIEMPKGGYVPVFLSAARFAPKCPARLAVMPLEVLSPLGGTEHYSRAICMSLTAGLTNIEGLETVAHAYCRDLPVRQLAGELRLTHLIQGSLARDGDGLRVVINLIQLADGTQLWAQEFDLGRGEKTGGIAREVVNEVAARLGRGKRQGLCLPMAA